MKLLIGANDSHALKLAKFKLNTNSADPNSEYNVEVESKFDKLQVKQVVNSRNYGPAFLLSDNSVAFVNTETSLACKEIAVAIVDTQAGLYRILQSGNVDKYNPELNEFSFCYTLPLNPETAAASNSCLVAAGKGKFVITKLEIGDVVYTGKCPLESVVCWCANADSDMESDSVVFGTKTGEVLAFDSTEKRVKTALRVSKDAIKSICALDDETFAVGDSRGLVQKVQLRPLKALGHFKGVQGSTRALTVYDKLLATGGLDRYLRIFNVESRKMLAQVYIGDVIQTLAIVSTDREERDDAENEMWDEIEHNGKKRRVVPSTESKRKAVTKSAKKDESEELSEEESEELSEEFSEEEVSDDDNEDDSFEGFE